MTKKDKGHNLCSGQNNFDSAKKKGIKQFDIISKKKVKDKV